MTLKKKALAAIGALFAVAVIVAASVLGTVAYLTSSAAVSNVFTIGNVGITMTETKVDPNGVKIEPYTQVDTNTYHLVPNKKYSKDPVVTVNAASESSYLFVLVRNDLETIERNDSDDADEMTIAEQLAANGWAKYTTASTGWVYVYCGAGNVSVADAAVTTSGFTFSNTAVPVGSASVETYKLFDYFCTHENAKTETYGAAKITLTAVAIQTAGFKANPETGKTELDAAWQAVIETYPYIHTGNQ